MLYPLTFHPIFKERVWGARNIERLYGKLLPAGVPIGESWEISDRLGDVSVIANGPLAGKTLHWLMENHAAQLLGSAKPQNGRFPLLIKILDANEKLSLQVHPPANRAQELGGEPKTEMWYIADAAPGAHLFAGLKRGVTRAEFDRRIGDGTVADCFHRIEVKPGDSMFLPSGRVHAIGEGNVIFEIQQNSDTTYRVFDWNRAGLDGKPRELHVAQSLASIDFTDFEPSLIQSEWRAGAAGEIRPLVSNPLFKVDAVALQPGQTVVWSEPACGVLGVLDGRLNVSGGGQSVELTTGQFCLLPATIKGVALRAEVRTTLLKAVAG